MVALGVFSILMCAIATIAGVCMVIQWIYRHGYKAGYMDGETDQMLRVGLKSVRRSQVVKLVKP